MELGTALLRRHAAAVWRPWLLVMVASFVLANGMAWALGAPWLGLLLCWWLKPALERVPLYVLSRAVFGQVPGTAATLRAQPRFAPGTLPAFLLWRRWGPARSLLMPVDLLEGSAGAQRVTRRHVVAGPAYAQASLLTLVSLAFELALALACVALVVLFVPPDLLPASARALGQAVDWPPPGWLYLAINAVAWTAALVVGPFYVAAGFGTYLNRRTGSEAWDVELAFRRLRRRLLSRGAPLLLALCVALPFAVRAGGPGPTAHGQKQHHASDSDSDSDAPRAEDSADPTPTLPQVFGEPLQDPASFRRATTEAYRDPLLDRERIRVRWRPRNPAQPAPEAGLPPWLASLGGYVALIAEFGLWLLLGLVVLVLLVTAPRWLPWLRMRLPRAGRRARPASIEVEALPPPDPLPADIPSAVRRLWAAGQARAALALLYRASVEAMAARARIELAPGATEAQCLRAAAALAPEAGRILFTRTVRTWQYAAYAGRLPEDHAFEALLDEATACWGWRR